MAGLVAGYDFSRECQENVQARRSFHEMLAILLHCKLGSISPIPSDFEEETNKSMLKRIPLTLFHERLLPSIRLLIDSPGASRFPHRPTVHTSSKYSCLISQAQ